eukprot:1460908-Rhodomonas_salina.3
MPGRFKQMPACVSWYRPVGSVPDMHACMRRCVAGVTASFSSNAAFTLAADAESSRVTWQGYHACQHRTAESKSVRMIPCIPAPFSLPEAWAHSVTGTDTSSECAQRLSIRQSSTPSECWASRNTAPPIYLPPSEAGPGPHSLLQAPCEALSCFPAHLDLRLMKDETSTQQRKMREYQLKGVGVATNLRNYRVGHTFPLLMFKSTRTSIRVFTVSMLRFCTATNSGVALFCDF